MLQLFLQTILHLQMLLQRDVNLTLYKEEETTQLDDDIAQAVKLITFGYESVRLADVHKDAISLALRILIFNFT